MYSWIRRLSHFLFLIAFAAVLLSLSSVYVPRNIKGPSKISAFELQSGPITMGIEATSEVENAIFEKFIEIRDEVSQLAEDDWQGIYSSGWFEDQLTLAVSKRNGAAYVFEGNFAIVQQGVASVGYRDSELTIYNRSDPDLNIRLFSEPLVSVLWGEEFYLIPKGYVHSFILLQRNDPEYVQAVCLSKRLRASARGAKGGVEIPVEYQGLIHEPIVRATVVNVIQHSAELDHSVVGGKLRYELKIDSGDTNRLFVGMRLTNPLSSAEITVVSIGNSFAIAEETDLSLTRPNVEDNLSGEFVTPTVITYWQALKEK